jgi:HAD superfamily hydrolase (TIGR01493 family)
MDNVLYDATFWQRWLWQLLSRMGVHNDFQQFSDRWQRGFLTEVHRGAATFGSALRRFLEDRGLTAARIDEVEAASAAKRRELNESVRPLPGVSKTLSQLAAAGIVLGVLANSELSGDELTTRLGRLGLGKKFQFAYSSCERRCAKPDPACYESALIALELAGPQVAFVSTHADDLVGATKLGIHAIGLRADTGTAVSVQRFEELVPICVPSPRCDT